jgi:hypothetical protein
MLLPVLLALVVVLLALVAVFSDGRNRQKAQGSAIAAVQARTAAHAKQLGTLERAVAALVPPDARPTAPHAAAAVYSGRDQLPPPPLVPRGLPSHSTDEAPPTPQRSADAVERQIAEMKGAPAEPIATEGDRAGVNPGDDVSELGRLSDEGLELARLTREKTDAQDAKEIRERFQRAADAQDERDASGAAPPGDDDRPIEMSGRESEEPEDERTRVHTRPPLSALHPLAGVKPERHTSSATRTAEAFAAAHPESTTRPGGARGSRSCEVKHEEA